jgi:hypothetical protein
MSGLFFPGGAHEALLRRTSSVLPSVVFNMNAAYFHATCTAFS